MVAEQKATFNFDAMLKTAMSEGNAGRTELVARLAALPVEDLARVKPSTLAMLGASGLAALTQARDDLPSGLTPNGRPPSGMPDPTEPVGAVRKGSVRRTVFPGLLILLILLAGAGAEHLRPLAAAMNDPGWRRVDVSTWPTCQRLAPYVDGCLYRTVKGSTSLADIANHLAMPVPDLVAVNRHLLSASRSPLKPGSKVVVWRGRLELKADRP